MKKVVLSLFVLIVIGCGDNDSKSGNPPNEGFGVEDMRGNWKQTCINIDDHAATSGALRITDNTFEMAGKVYRSADCQSKLDLETSFNFEYSVYDAPNSKIPGLKYVDATLKNVFLTLHSNAMVELSNYFKLCGYSDWQVGVAKEVSGKNCDGENYPDIGDKMYQIVKLEAGKLFKGRFGELFDGKTPDTRPQSLEIDPYTKN